MVAREQVEKYSWKRSGLFMSGCCCKVDGGKLFRMLIIGFQFPFLLLRNSERVLFQFPSLFYPNYTI